MARPGGRNGRNHRDQRPSSQQGVSADEFNSDSRAEPTFALAVERTVSGSKVTRARATPLTPETTAGSLRRRLQQDACKVDFTILSEGGDGQTEFVQALQDGTFTDNFDAVKGQSPSLRGASVDEERSREENGDAVKKKKGGSGDGPPILLIILAAVGGCVRGRSRR